MTAVVLVGELPSTGIIPEPVAWRVADSAAPEATLAFVQQTAGALQQHGAVLVIYPAWRPQAAVRLVRQARAFLSTDRIAAIPLDLPPLALSLIADQLAFMAPHVRPGLLASLVQVLADRLYTGAWVSSVAKLEHVQTGLGQHMASLMPGSGFMVAAVPKPVVHRVTAAKPVPEIGHRPLDPVLMLAAHEHGDVNWLQDRLKPELRVVTLTYVSAQPLSTRYWGAKKYAEFVAFSGHPRDLHLAMQSADCTPCPWCEEPTALAICPFCSRVQDRPVPGPVGASAAPGPEPVRAGATRPQPTPPSPAVPAPERVPLPLAAPTPEPPRPPAPHPQPPQPAPPAVTAPQRTVAPSPPPLPPPRPPAPGTPPPAPGPPHSFGGPEAPPTAPQPVPPPDRRQTPDDGDAAGPSRAGPPATDFALPRGGRVVDAPPAPDDPEGRREGALNGSRRAAPPPEPEEQPPTDPDETTRTGTIEFRPLRNR
ncbi:hypothetical protein [Actinomadura sp. 9N407]|uniref:hypothetical protein n=1 Tax=Actinomadura sp. 9N407 TaxID=3375154 RepID=UPI0037AF15BB